MTVSTMEPKLKRKKEILVSIAIAIFWVVIWQIMAMLIGEEIFIASPIAVIETLLELSKTSEFYQTVGFSITRIVSGFLLGSAVGTALAMLSYKVSFVEILLRPFMGAVKAAPVASFVVLALLAVGSKNLAVLISFLMVLPIFYSNILAGEKSVERERFDAAEVFGMTNYDRFRFIYLPYVEPFFSSACRVGMGIAWKAGVSAEVIGIASGSIGGKLYDAKLSLETAELLAYTLVVVILSLILEKLLVILIGAADKCLTRDSCQFPCDKNDKG